MAYFMPSLTLSINIEMKDVGYLMARFEYFQGRFAYEADQEWTKIEVDELYLMDYLFSS